VNDQEGHVSGEPDPFRGRELNPREGEVRSGPGRFATPQYSGDYGAEYAGPAGAVPLDPAYDRSAYGHYEAGQAYTPSRRDRARMLPLPAGITYASWGSRFGAWVVDLLAQLACLAPAVGAAVLVDSALGTTEIRSTGAQLLVVVVYVLGWLAGIYQITWRQGARGQSWGKQAMGIHLVNANDFQPPGGAIGIARYVLRSVFSGMTCGVYLLVTAFWPLSDPRMQTLDDKLMNTVVVRLPPERAVF
jgi:uncharacterized RDD family membrane protein YckC